MFACLLFVFSPVCDGEHFFFCCCCVFGLVDLGGNVVEAVLRVVDDASAHMPELKTEILSIKATTDWRAHPNVGGSYSGATYKGNFESYGEAPKYQLGSFLAVLKLFGKSHENSLKKVTNT
jgi:hypothetical protein